MIPKRAIFLWVGEDDLPWMRQLSIDSFKKFNPDWSVDLVRVPKRAHMLAEQCTDIYRYWMLYDQGGVYLDTDIVFIKPFPPGVLEEHNLMIGQDGSVCHGKETDPFHPGFSNIAILGSEPGCSFFKTIYDSALERYELMVQDGADLTLGYQLFGVSHLNRLFYGQLNPFGDYKSYNVPLDMVLPIRWNELYKLYNGTPFNPPERTIGVHWYGGSVDAKMFQSRATPENYKRFPYYISSAIERALA